jgi:tetratricopeptide (TPR) repeat protein
MPKEKNKAKKPERVVRQNRRNIVPPDNIPSAKEIALIASNLIGENRYIKSQEAIDQAFDLLRQAEDKLEDIRVEKADLRFHQQAHENEMDQIAERTKVPDAVSLGLVSFLKIVVGGKTKGEQEEKFKRFLEANYKDSKPEETILKLKRNGFERQMAWMDMGESYQDWNNQWKIVKKAKGARASQKVQAIKRIDEQINSVGKNLPTELSLESFFNNYMKRKSHSEAKSLFTHFLKSLPENQNRPREVIDDVVGMPTCGFNKSTWIENASEYLKWKRQKIKNGEHI